MRSIVILLAPLMLPNAASAGAVVTFDDAIATVDKVAAASRDAGFPAERKE